MGVDVGRATWPGAALQDCCLLNHIMASAPLFSTPPAHALDCTCAGLRLPMAKRTACMKLSAVTRVG